MKIQAVRGTRDFYPEDMTVRNWLVDAWRRVSLRNGFREYDGPLLEHLELYTAKSGEEIVTQLFHLTDRGGRSLAIRPEMTPTLARMIGARAQSLPRPIKWFSIGRFCRAERPQRGRLREFLQWNVDIVGTDDLLADAESIFVAVDFLQEIGLGAQDVCVRINSRPVLGGIFAQMGIPADRCEEAFGLWDKAGKIPPERLAAAWDERLGECVPFDRIAPFLGLRGLDKIRQVLEERGLAEKVSQALADVERLEQLLNDFRITEFCIIDLGVVRGLAYYTGIVYEIFDRQGKLRALAGGGRYDNLLEMLGTTRMSGVGFGMGDAVLLELLGELNRLPTAAETLDFFVVDADGRLADRMLHLVGQLRRKGYSAEFPYRRQALAKQLKLAAERGAQRVVILGQETRERGAVTIKDMHTGKQIERDWEAFLNNPAG